MFKNQNSGPLHGRQTNYSFTLIELLVVVAIIAILAGMLLPALSSVKEVGKKALCFSNQKQFAVLHASYVNSNDDFIVPRDAPGYRPGYHQGAWAFQTPYLHDCSGANVKTLTWEILLSEQISNWKYKATSWYNPQVGPLLTTLPKVFFCPNGFVSPGRANYRLGNAAFYDIITWSFIYAPNHTPATGEVEYKKVKRLTRIKKPGYSLFLLDNGLFSTETNGKPSQLWHGGYIPGTGSAKSNPYLAATISVLTLYSTIPDIRNDVMNGRHRRSVNCLFQDGHVANIKAEEYFKQTFIPFTD